MLNDQTLLALHRWLSDRVDTEVANPLRATALHGGHSNLTYRVTGGDQSWVLRTPPSTGVLPTAHDMSRETRLMSALAGHLPVPRVIGFDSGTSLIGTSFLVMEFVDGLVPRDAEQMNTHLDAQQRHAASVSVVDNLAALHAVDPSRVGLADMGKPTGYVERQLRRWWQQFEATRSQDAPDLADTYRALKSTIPTQQATAVIHGDFRLDNTILGPSGEVSAILDWELGTRGDPLADVATLLMWWTEPGEKNSMGYEGPTSARDMLDREQAAHRYASQTGFDLDHLDFYLAFVHWRTACVAQGVLSRRLSGALGADTEVDADTMRTAVVHHAQVAAELTAKCS